MASELIRQLQAAIADRGDLPVYFQDPDTLWPLGFKLDPRGSALILIFPDLAPCMTLSSCLPRYRYQ